MDSLNKDFYTKFKIKELKIYETDYWVWSLRPIQTTIGSGVLSLKRQCESFSKLQQEEFCDLNNIIKVVESVLKKTFNYDVMNYLMLMMVDKQVHYHIIPRYENKVLFEGKELEDEFWPGLPNLTGETMDINMLNNICSYIKDNLKV